MAEISYIHGLPGSRMDAGELRQRGANVPVQRPIDYLQMTDGQLKLALLAEQLNILEGFYPENKVWRQGREMAENALWQGLHTAAGMGSQMAYSRELAVVTQTIRRAKKLTRPAGGVMIFQKQVGLGDPLVPMEPCDFPIKSQYGWDAAGGYGYATYNMYVQDQQKKKAACLEANKWRDILNTHLEKMAHHPLLEFIDNPQAKNLSPLGQGKPLLHRIAIDNISILSKIKRDNIRLWQRNGVMRNNAINGASPLSPEESIEGIMLNKQHGYDQKGVGTPFVVLAPLIVKVLIAATAAIAAATQFVQVLKTKQPNAAQSFQNSVQGWGGQNYGPGYDDFDFPTDGGSGGGGGNGGGGSDILSSENMPVLLAAGAGLLLLTSK